MRRCHCGVEEVRRPVEGADKAVETEGRVRGAESQKISQQLRVVADTEGEEPRRAEEGGGRARGRPRGSCRRAVEAGMVDQRS